ncbi:MAG: ROK family protein [Gammaproteobacteria bacterium]
MKLAADLGGTHARFALQAASLRCIDLPARDFASLDAALAAALAAFDIDDAHGIDAVLAVAGPVRGSTAAFTNLDWSADPDALRARFGFASLRLLNDVECAARAAAAALPNDVVAVHPGPRRDDGRHVLISVGTGLGVAYWHHSSVEASEAGHSGFAPATEWDHAFLADVCGDGRRASWERVLSGPGLARVGTFVAGAPYEDGAEVTQHAAQGDPLATDAVKRFSRLLGTFAGDLVLAAPVTGGVLLAGGVLAGLGPHFDAAEFIAGFRDKGAMAGLPATLPVWRTADGTLALRGALL